MPRIYSGSMKSEFLGMHRHQDFLNLHSSFQWASVVENHCFRLTSLHFSILRLVSLCHASMFRLGEFAQPQESDCIPGSRFPWNGLAHHQTTLDYEYILEPEGWEGYLKMQSKSFVVSLACNSNKCTPSALSGIGKIIHCRKFSAYEWLAFQNLFLVTC